MGICTSDYLELMKRCPLVTVRSEAQHKNALKVLKKLALKDKEMSVGEFEYFEVLSLLIKRYEEEHFRLSNPTPQAILRSFMQDHSLTQAAIADIAGEFESNISAFLANKRNLTKKSALRLAAHFSVDPALLQPPSFEQAS